MSVPGRASGTEQRPAGRIAVGRGAVGAQTSSCGLWASGGPARPALNAPATISPRSCVLAARARGYALRQRPLLTRSPRRQAKRIGARWDQAEHRWCAPHLWKGALERWLLSLPLPVLLAGKIAAPAPATLGSQVDTTQPGTLPASRWPSKGASRNPQT